MNNHVIYHADQDYLKTLKEEYEILGRETKISQGSLTIFSRPQRAPKKKKEDRQKRRDDDA